MTQLFPSETHLWRIVPKNKLLNKIQIRKSKSTWEQSCQCHLGAVLPVSFGNNRASFTWEQLCESHLRTIVPVSFGNNRACVDWEQSCQSHLGTFVLISLRNTRAWEVCASFTWEQSYQFHFWTNLPVSFVVNKKKWMKNWYFEFFPV